MKSLYSIFISVVEKLLPVSAWFSPKMKKFVTGRKRVFESLREKISPSDRVVWFHAASLGEYEQGVPVIEMVKKQFPKHKILLTFFSPSGYEVKKNNHLADCTVYLPLDTRRNARKFLELAHPEWAVFIKYEVWPNYLFELKKRAVKTVLISGAFRENQIYFKWYGQLMRKSLHHFDRFFVQNEVSKELLGKLGLKNVTISGDTRFDRVSHQIEQNNRLDFMDDFKGNALCTVCGSTWSEDEVLLVEYINQAPENMKFVLAPHEIKPKEIDSLQKKIQKKTVLYSKMGAKKMNEYQVLLLDTVGLLSKIYSYADIAYVGGAMGNTGLHNILEPATFGVPIVIGKNYDHFPEAKKLEKIAGLFSIGTSGELKKIMNKLVEDTSFRKKTGMISGHFVQNNTGASQKIIDYIAINQA